MIDLYGITEIIGNPGTGKTNLSLSVANEKILLYISYSILTNKNVPKNIFIKRINTFLKFKIFILKDLKKAVKTFKIEMIIIDGFEQFFYCQNQPRKHYNDIFRIINKLKDLCFNQNIDIIIINGLYDNYSFDRTRTYNKYLGYNWCYMPNRRYLIIKENRIFKINNLNKGDTEYFKINSDNIVEFIKK